MSNNYQFKVNQTKYGQTVMCVTIRQRLVKTTIRTYITVESLEFAVVHFPWVAQPHKFTSLAKKKKMKELVIILKLKTGKISSTGISE